MRTLILLKDTVYFSLVVYFLHSIYVTVAQINDARMTFVQVSRWSQNRNGCGR